MAVNTDRTLAGDPWLLRLLVATALLQTTILSASLGGLVVFWAASHSALVHDVLVVANALVVVMIRSAFHILTLS